MARHLDHIVVPLRNYLNRKSRFRLPNGDGRLLPPLEVARRCGEAQLLLQFFALMEKLHHTDHGRQLELWDQLVVNGGYILDLVQRIGLFERLVLPADADPKHWAYIAYCIFLHSLHGEPKRDLFNLATKNFLYHHYLGLYPKNPANRTMPPEVLRRRAQVRLNKGWGIGTELKESFKARDEQSMEFSLRIKPPGKAWQTLLTEEGDRLKPTRIAAYQRLLDELETGKHSPEMYQNERT